MSTLLQRTGRPSSVNGLTPLVPYRFTVQQYDEMGRRGILDEDDRVELIDGEVVQMSPIGWPHASCVNRLNRLLIETLGRRATVAIQNPVVLDEFSEPQPDVVVARYRRDGYAQGHPRPDDAFLVIEVSDTTYEYDSGKKLPLYARQGIREAILVDLEHDRVEVHRRPAKSGYKGVRRLRRGEKLTLLAIPDVTLAVEEILGPRPK